jgi:hypothetical protein
MNREMLQTNYTINLPATTTIKGGLVSMLASISDDLVGWAKQRGLVSLRRGTNVLIGGGGLVKEVEGRNHRLLGCPSHLIRGRRN